MLGPMTRAERGRAAGAIACALALATGCGSQTPTAAPPTPAPAPAPAPAGATADARAKLEQALQPLAPQDGADRARSLAKVIADAIAPGDGCLAAFASASPTATVRAACPADAGQESSITQLVFDHAGKLLATAYTGADTGKLDQLLAALPVRLPLPAKSAACELPAVAGAPLSAGFGGTYVVVGADDALHAGRFPMATIRAGGVDVKVDRGAPFPGEAVDIDTIAAAVARLRGAAAIESAGAKLPLAQAPLLLMADRRMQATGTVEAATHVLWSVLAVADPDGVAEALPVHLRVAPPGERGPQPFVAVTNETVAVGVIGTADVTKLARVTDGSAAPAGLADALSAARSKAPASAEVRVFVDGPATTAEFAQLLAAVHAAGVDAVTVQMGQPKLAPPPEPKVRISAVNVKGRLAPAAVSKALAHHRDDLLTCFTESEGVKPGSITVSFIVAPTGRSAGAHTKGGDPKLAECVADVTDTLRFPRPKGAASVSYRVDFSLAGR